MSQKLSRRKSLTFSKSAISRQLSSANTVKRASISISNAPLQEIPDDDAPLVTSEEVEYRIIPPQFRDVIPATETYIMSSRVKCPSEKIREFVLTRNFVYKLVREGDDYVIKNTWDIRDIYRIGAFPNNPTKKVFFHIKQLHIPAELNRKTKVHGFGIGEPSWDCIRKKEYVCETIYERIDWVWALSRMSIERWQQFFECLTMPVETNIVPEPEVYQIHYFCCLLNKKKFSLRYIVLSTHKVYNVEVRIIKDKVEVIKTKWALPIKDIGGILYYPRTDNRAITFLVEPTSALIKGKVLKEEFTLIMNSENERNDMYALARALHSTNNISKFEILRLHVNMGKKKLPVTVGDKI